MSLHSNEIAAQYVGTIWAALKASGGPEAPPDAYHYFPQAFDPAWIESVPLPVDESGVVYLGDHDSFERLRPEEVAAAYATRQRTTIYSQIERQGWTNTAAQHLLRLSGVAVTFSVYHATPDDETLGAHRDKFAVVATQWKGEKSWWLGEDAWDTTGSIEPTVTLTPGDVLVVPKDFPHNVYTSGAVSTHLTASFILDKPIATALN